MPFRLIFLSELPTEVHAVSLQRQLLLFTDELCCGCLPVPLAQPLTLPSALGSLLCPPLPTLACPAGSQAAGAWQSGTTWAPLGIWGLGGCRAPCSCKLALASPGKMETAEVSFLE